MSEESKADALFLSMEVEDPSRFGIVEGEPMADGVVKVKRLVEKPSKPASKLAIMPVYVFDSKIFRALEDTKAGFAGELQLTDGIQRMVDWDLNVYTTKVASSEIWLDIGSPDLFWQAQNLSHKHYSHDPVE
jgi:dTDP-glucose pyrophosphorylase